MIVWAHARHTFTDFAHYPGTLVSEYERRACGPVSSRGMQIAMANAGRLQFNQDLASPWRL